MKAGYSLPITAILLPILLLVSWNFTQANAAQADTLPANNARAGEFLGANTIADIVHEASPGVVNIVALVSLSREQAARLHGEHPHDTDNRRVRRHFGLDVDESSGNQVKVTGSGIVMRSDGYILTSFHVVKEASEIRVTMFDGASFNARFIGKDNFTDLALIKIDRTGLFEPKFGDANKLRLGEWVVAIGNQFGLEHTVTAGLISGLHREAKAFTPSFGARSGSLRFIQTDAPINPGSSGGPLLNLKGEIVGVNSFIRDDAQNIGFAIPANLAFEVADKLIKKGFASHPYIGIEMREPADLPLIKSMGEGVEITKVRSTSPASAAGLEPGDFITEVDSSAVRNPGDVSQAVGRHAIGEAVTVRVKRKGSARTLVVKVESLPDDLE